MKVDEGKWGWSESFTTAKVIKWWGIWPPSKFYDASVEDRAYAIVTYETEMKILAYQQKLDRLKNEAESLKSKGSSD